MKIDLKNLVLGFAAGVGAMLLSGATTSTPPGRYQVAGSPPLFLLVDTTTGRVWMGNFNTTSKSTDAGFFAAKSN